MVPSCLSSQCVVGSRQRCATSHSLRALIVMGADPFSLSLIIMKTTPVVVGKIMFLFLLSLLSLGWYGPKTTLAVDADLLQDVPDTKSTHLRALAELSHVPDRNHESQDLSLDDEAKQNLRALDTAPDCEGFDNNHDCNNEHGCSWIKDSCVDSCSTFSDEQDCIGTGYCFFRGDSNSCIRACDSFTGSTPCQERHDNYCSWDEDAKKCTDISCDLVADQFCEDRLDCFWDEEGEGRPTCKFRLCNDPIVTQDQCLHRDDCVWFEDSNGGGSCEAHCEYITDGTQCVGREDCFYNGEDCYIACKSAREEKECKDEACCKWSEYSCTQLSCGESRVSCRNTSHCSYKLYDTHTDATYGSCQYGCKSITLQQDCASRSDCYWSPGEETCTYTPCSGFSDSQQCPDPDPLTNKAYFCQWHYGDENGIGECKLSGCQYLGSEECLLEDACEWDVDAFYKCQDINS